MTARKPVARNDEPDRVPGSERERILATFAGRYPEVQYAFVQFLSEHLADCCRSFGGDLDLPMILSVIGQSHISAFLAQPEGRMGQISYGISALRVADITGLPRETVRRKLRKLEALGWVRQGAEGWTLDGPNATDTNARRDLDALNQRGLERLARLHVDIGKLVARPPEK